MTDRVQNRGWKEAMFGCHRGWTYCKWGQFDHSRVIDQIRWNFFTQVEWWQDRPRHIQWLIANTLSRWAHEIRGGKKYDLGYGMVGNRAAQLEYNLRFRFIPTPPGMDNDEACEAFAEIEELAQLARATTWVEY